VRFPEVQRGVESIRSKENGSKVYFAKIDVGNGIIACCVMIINMIPDLIVYAVRHTLHKR